MIIAQPVYEVDSIYYITRSNVQLVYEVDSIYYITRSNVRAPIENTNKNGML